MEPGTSENAFEPLREAAIAGSVLTHPALGEPKFLAEKFLRPSHPPPRRHRPLRRSNP